MQTLKIRYSISGPDRVKLDGIRRVQSAGIRTAYANAVGADGKTVPEKELRKLVKDRFGPSGVLDSWALHCAAREGLAKRTYDHKQGRKRVFGSKKQLQRRQQGSITKEEWQRSRLGPFISSGDSQKACGNQNVHLIDENTLMIKIGRKEHGKGRSGKTITDRMTLHLGKLTGNAGEIVRQVAAICAKPSKAQRINVSYAIGDEFVSIIIDPLDLPDHPERRVPVAPLKGRVLGLDLNPSWVGMTAIENTGRPDRLEDTRIRDHALVQIKRVGSKLNAEETREMLAAVCDRAIGMARNHRCGPIVIEDGLGHLRSGGKNKKNNYQINSWARNLLIGMMQRKAGLAGIKVLLVRAYYSSIIGNLAFEAPDACASAAEIARRGYALTCGIKDVLPGLDEGMAHLWKDAPLLDEVLSWDSVHRSVKAAGLGGRRPHPPRVADSDVPAGHCPGYAVRRLKHRHRPGFIFRPLKAPMAQASQITGVAVANSTR